MDSYHVHNQGDGVGDWGDGVGVVLVFLSTTMMVGLLKLAKYCLLFFSSRVVTKKVLVGAANMYSVILPVLVSILTPPALFFAKAQISRSGRQINSFRISGFSFRLSRRASLVAGIATSSSPFSFSFKLSPKPNKFQIMNSCVPFLGPSTQYLTILCLFSSEKMIEEVDFSQTMPLGNARSFKTTEASLVLRLNETILPNLCLNRTSLLENLMEIVVASVTQTIWLSSSMQRLLRAVKAFPSMPLKRQVGVLDSMSSFINPLYSVTKQRVLSSLVMMIPQTPLVSLNLYKTDMAPVEFMTAMVPSLNPVQMVPSLATAMSSGYLRVSALVITRAFSKYLGMMCFSNVVSRGPNFTDSASNCAQSMGHLALSIAPQAMNPRINTKLSVANSFNISQSKLYTYCQDMSFYSYQNRLIILSAIQNQLL